MFYATKATVDLGAIRANLAAVKSRAGSRAIMQTVKADAYGHGAVEVASMIQNSRCADWLGVATVSEGIELRSAGITLPILKLSHAFLNEIGPALTNNLVLTVVDARTIQQVNAVASGLSRVAKVHLAVDTGMGRIGCRPEQALDLARLVDSLESVTLDGIFTHLPAADCPASNDFTHAELQLFADTVRGITECRGRVKWVHCANSAAILAHDLAETTMVRSGIMAYGYYPDETTPRTVDLCPALSLSSRISFIKQVHAGESVGYGRTWTAKEDTWVATVPIGYADGFSRLNSNRGSVLIGGRRYPVIGRVCMDQIMVDLGEQTPRVAVGDDVTVIGRDGDEVITADDLAKIAGTISYEVTSLITNRVERIYIDNG